MANTKQAKKRVRQAITRREHNKSLHSKFRTHVKNVRKAVLAGSKDTAAAALKAAHSVIDQTVSKGLIHKNKAARLKSRLNARVKDMQAA